MPKKKPVLTGMTARTLAHELGLSRETLFGWIARGLLPPVAFRGASTRYDASVQVRARRIARLRAEGLSYADVATRIAEFDAEPAPPPAPSTGVPTWERVTLLPGLELHVATGASELVRRVAAEVIARYRASAAQPVSSPGSTNA